jgi:hypothetical protein
MSEWLQINPEVLKYLFYGLKSKLFLQGGRTQTAPAYLILTRTKRTDHSMTLPSLAALGGSPEPGHLRSVH